MWTDIPALMHALLEPKPLRNSNLPMVLSLLMAATRREVKSLLKTAQHGR
jgi:hypothetical protein